MTKIVVGMSGGVDSSLTAALLAEQGHEVLGVYMENWTDAGVVHGCASWPEDRRDAATVAKHLKIPFKAIDFEKEYRAKVIEYFFAEYAAGRTPNPDVLCNREIKFGVLLEWAKQHGYDAVATGHYARVEGSPPHLLKGVDQTKDQSYFLCQLSRDQLEHALFPLGDTTKRWVRAEAEKRKLPVAKKPDSQGLCFVGQIDLPGFLQTRIDHQPGDVVTMDGEIIGTHHGAAFYTVGQRRGVGVTKPVPVYVLGTDLAKNEVIVGYERELYANKIVTEKPHWTSGRAPKALWHGRTGRYDVAIRYRMKPAAAKVVSGPKGLQITFDEAQRGPTPGQFAVLYDGEELVGSAVITGNPLLGRDQSQESVRLARR
jgi:tRNA-specific 2-thiouridylase